MVKRASMRLAFASVLVASTVVAAPRCDWAGKVGGKSIWLSTK